MAKCMKCGGAKMKAGGYVPGKTSPLYDNNPRTSSGQQLGNGGSVKDRIIKGGSLRREEIRR